MYDLLNKNWTTTVCDRDFHPQIFFLLRKSIKYYYCYQKKFFWRWNCLHGQPDLAARLSQSSFKCTQLDWAPHWIESPSMQPNFWIGGYVFVLRCQRPGKFLLWSGWRGVEWSGWWVPILLLPKEFLFPFYIAVLLIFN